MPRPPVAKPFLSQKSYLNFKTIPGLNVCGFRYFRIPKLTHQAFRILIEKRNVLYQKTRERADARDRSIIWLHVNANQLQAKRVVRIRAQRRLRSVFHMSLNEHGYDKDGRSLVSHQRGLKGSVELYALGPAVTEKFEEMKSQMGMIVQSIISESKSLKPGLLRNGTVIDGGYHGLEY